MVVPSFSDFKQMATRGNLIPVFEEIHYDLETPLSAFRKIDDGKSSFLLESVEGGEKWGRYSFLGSGSSHLFRSKGEEFEILKKGEVLRKGKVRDPLLALEDFMGIYHPVLHDDLPRFSGGAVGYLSYDVVRSFERLPSHLQQDIDLYDASLMVTDVLLAFDNLKKKIKIIINVFLDGRQSAEEAYQEAQEKIQSIIARLQKLRSPSSGRKPFPPSPLRSNFSKEDYMKVVERAKEYIRAGDIIQVVPSQRFSKEIHCEPFDIYRALRSINPSPYLFYLKMNDMVLMGSSPEVMVRLEGKQVELRPIAGTCRRGKTREEDLVLEKDLLADEKEKAEHIMLVDLGRNDVGRVSEIGSVRVTELMTVERYSHVMHIVSNVQGKLAPGRNGFDVFRATFPAGTVSGAPKIRAMEIIEELEPSRRGFYAGAVGYFSFLGNMDTCITIRSILIKDGKAYVQVGGGVVADSDPEKEYEETLHKAQAIFKAIELAEEGLS
ncbi:MAG: anthranilate synthase component I [Deltaproteobacteria bacterium RBG_16_47_11]|nr:MAG: anthranilate synthase component I [Deltaproteobacteria bacterium RBG_16_47_11]